MPNPTRRAAIVTGAAGGIGSAIAARLEKDGVDVLAVDLEPADTRGGPAVSGVAFAADLTTHAGNRAAVDAALEHFGRLDIIVANAGFQHVSPIADFPEQRWDALIALMLTSPFLLAKYGWSSLREAPEGGRFLVIASAHALVASPFKAGYVAAKHGALGLVKTLALEGAEHGISACAICPAYAQGGDGGGKREAARGGDRDIAKPRQARRQRRSGGAGQPAERRQGDRRRARRDVGRRFDQNQKRGSDR